MSLNPRDLDLAGWERRLRRDFASETASSVGHGDHGDPPDYLASIDAYIRHMRAQIPPEIYEQLIRRYS